MGRKGINSPILQIKVQVNSAKITSTTTQKAKTIFIYKL